MFSKQTLFIIALLFLEHVTNIADWAMAPH